MQAATEVFVRHGYVGATMDEVAARASVSKQTLYKQFSDKENLFADVILEAILTQLFGRLTNAADAAAESDDARAGLRALADSYLAGLLQPDVIRLRRLVIGEADRFPAVGKVWFDQGFERTLELLGGSAAAARRTRPPPAPRRPDDGSLALRGARHVPADEPADACRHRLPT